MESIHTDSLLFVVQRVQLGWSRPTDEIIFFCYLINKIREGLLLLLRILFQLTKDTVAILFTRWETVQVLFPV